jgi:hypothetical protein
VAPVHSKPLAECTAREKTERWRDSHAQGVAETKERFVRDGVRPDKAESRAKAMHERTTANARRNSERG